MNVNLLKAPEDVIDYMIISYRYLYQTFSYEEFEGIALRIIKKLPPNVVIQIASSVWKYGSRDIRDVLKIAKLCNPSDGEDDITRLMTIHQKYRKTSREYN